MSVLISDKGMAKLYVRLQLPHVEPLVSIPHPPNCMFHHLSV